MQKSSDFVDKATDPLGDRAEANGLESLSYPEQVALLVLWADGIIGNGGFRFFYEGANNTEQVANAYQSLGCHDAVQASRDTMAIFPPEVFEKDYKACQKWLDSRYNDEELENLFDKQDRVIWEASDTLYDVLAEYIKTHRSDFEAVEQEIK